MINPIREARIVEALPCWSLPCIINGDESGLNPDEITLINNWLAFWGNDRYMIVSVPENAEGSFNSRPAFGLPCDCIDCEIIVRVQTCPNPECKDGWLVYAKDVEMDFIKEKGDMMIQCPDPSHKRTG